MPFVPLSLEHGPALRSYLADYGGGEIPGYFCGRDWAHERCVTSLAAWARGEQLSAGWVPCSTVFLEKGGELVGHYNFRHHLSPGLERYGGHVGYAVRPSARGRGHATALLGEARREAAVRGLDEVLLTVNPDNVPSVRVIEKNGGRLVETYWHEDEGRDVCLYWVPTR